MPITQQDLTKILSWLDQSHWQELQLESGGFKLSYSKSGRPAAPEGRSLPRPAAAPAPAVAPAVSAAAAKPAAAAAPATLPPGMAGVRAPTLGTFYLAPKPGAPPFVQVGQQVGEEDPVAIVEVMKLMNIVKAGVKGTVRSVCAANGDMVEYDQLLFVIEPEAGT